MIRSHDQEEQDLHDIWRLTAHVVTAERERDEARALARQLRRFAPGGRPARR